LFAPEIAVLMALKVVLRCVPTAVMAVMITTDMSAAIRPYSIGAAVHVFWRIDVAPLTRVELHCAFPMIAQEASPSDRVRAVGTSTHTNIIQTRPICVNG
jgi:hypothetical protein